jgi:hypothetical protein
MTEIVTDDHEANAFRLGALGRARKKFACSLNPSIFHGFNPR